MIGKNDPENWGIELPLKWLYLEDRIFTQEGKQVMTLEEVKRINKESNIIQDEEELKQFLCFHHKIGTFLYYHDHGISDLVVLDPQWMINSLKQIITIEKEKLKPFLQGEREELYNKGLLYREFIEVVWSGHKSFFEHQDKLLTLMEKLNIITSLVTYDAEGNHHTSNDTPQYIVPCMLRSAPDTFLANWMKTPTKSSALAFVFKEYIDQVADEMC